MKKGGGYFERKSSLSPYLQLSTLNSQRLLQLSPQICLLHPLILEQHPRLPLQGHCARQFRDTILNSTTENNLARDLFANMLALDSTDKDGVG